MIGKELEVIDLGYGLLFLFYGWVENFVSVRYTWAFHIDFNFVIDNIVAVVSLSAVVVALRSLHFTRKAYEVSIRNNKKIIMRERMIGAMNNITSYVCSGGSYRGAGMCVTYPIKDKVRSDMGIISKWNYVTPKSNYSGGNHHFVFTYRIFFGSNNDLNNILNENDWSDTDESVTIHLIRTSDGNYTLADRVVMKSYDEFTSEGRTIYLEDRNYNYVMMILDTLMMWDINDLMKYQDMLDNYNKDRGTS